MSDDLDFLRADDEDTLGKLAEHLVHQDNELHLQLVKHRINSGLTREIVAERLGVAVETIAEFEAYWHDPRLSELRRYALAIGVPYEHIIKESLMQCRRQVNLKPWWMSEGQFDPCLCILDKGHEGRCKCDHDFGKAPD